MGALLDSAVGYKIPKTVRIRDRTLAAYAGVVTVSITVRKMHLSRHSRRA